MSTLFTGGIPLGQGIGGAILKDASLTDLLAGYRRRIAGNYRPLPPEEIVKLPSGKMWVSEKIDGELWFLLGKEGETILANPQGVVISGKIEILDAAKNLPEGVIIAGELHAKVEGRRARVGDLAAAMAGGASAKTESIAFSAFDLAQEAGSTELGGYADRLAKLQSLIKSSDNLLVISTETPATAGEVKSLFESRVLSGDAEGLVIRLETGLIYKLKPEVKLRMVITAYTVKADQPEMVRSVLLGVSCGEGRWQILGGCGNMGSDEERRALLARLKPLVIESGARIASDGGGLYSFVKPEVAGSVTATDLQKLKSDGTPVEGLLLNLSGPRWESIGMKATLRPIHPVLSKAGEVDPAEALFSQIETYLPPKAEGSEVPAKLPESTIVRREVWTKEAKGQTAVRKLLVWKTNKEAINSAFPAYVVHWTDYSASRATPLDRDVRTAPDEKSAMALAEELITENIKKGWEKAA